MLWREGYRTEVVRGFVPPSALRGASLAGAPLAVESWDGLLLGLGPPSLGGVEGWRRLTEADADGAKVAVVVLEAGDLEGLVPRSRAATTFTASGEGWAEVLGGRVAAWCPRAALLMLGPATEEAWEQFQAALLG